LLVTQSIDALQDDVAYLRRMSEAGRRGPPLGGLLLAGFGGFVGLAALLTWARAFSLIPFQMPLPNFAVGFIVFALVGLSTPEPSPRRLRIALIAAVLAAAAMMLPYGAWLVWAQAIREGRDPGNLLALARYAPLVFLVGPTFMIGLSIWLISKLRRHAWSERGVNRVAGAAWISVLAALAVIIGIFFLAGLRTNNWFMMMSLPGVFWAAWGVPWLATGLAGGPRWAFAVAGGSWVLALVYGATFELFLTSAIGLFGLSLLPGLIMIQAARTTPAAA
jgi:hypothetical protein